ncbi:MAG: hypothetical protein M1839_003224 [Geoglossum umbratile]|nr:MAG: hypothetical protein M1839_003224 [Geoglossum umbratile]
MTPGSTIRQVSAAKTSSATSTDSPRNGGSGISGARKSAAIAVPIVVVFVLAFVMLAWWWARRRTRARAAAVAGPTQSNLPEGDEKLPSPHLAGIAEVHAQSANLPYVSEAPAYHFYPTGSVEAASQPAAPRNVAEAPTQLGHPTSVAEMPTGPSDFTALVEAPTEVETPGGDIEVSDPPTSDQAVVQPEQAAASASSTNSELEDKINQLKKEQARIEERRKRFTELQRLDEQEEALAKQLDELERRASMKAPG